MGKGEFSLQSDSQRGRLIFPRGQDVGLFQKSVVALLPRTTLFFDEGFIFEDTYNNALIKVQEMKRFEISNSEVPNNSSCFKSSD